MDRKDLKKQTLLILAIVIGIIIAINVISTRVFTRIDLSKNKTYTLSPVSKNLVGGLQDILTVKAFFSDNLPAPYNMMRREVKDLLNDYRSYSKGNLEYEFYNPSGDEENNELQKEAQKYGIQPAQVQVINNDKMETMNTYLGLVFIYNGKQEVLPFVQNTENLEYEITNAIQKLTLEKKKKIGFLSGHGEYDYTKFKTLSQVLDQQYDLNAVDLNKTKNIDADLLLVLGTNSDVPEHQKIVIDQYIMKGGRVAFLLNKVVPNQQQQIMIGDIVKNNLDDMLANYGIVINQDLIRDLQCAAVQVNTGMGFPVSVNYPYFPAITNINRDIAAFKNIQSVVASFVSSLDTQLPNTKGVKFTPLLTTSDKSGKAEGFFILNLDQFQNLKKSQVDSMFNSPGFVVGGIYEGNFQSFYSGKPTPQDTSTSALQYTDQVINSSQKPSKILVIGDADIANDESRGLMKENSNFFINMVEYMVDDVGLGQIRTKSSSEAPIGEVSDGTKKFIKYFNLIFPPLAVLLIGLFMWNKKKTKKKNLQNK